jgi:ABC-type cobalamin/Fe3+-siderophores transport system ATPase subunit
LPDLSGGELQRVLLAGAIAQGALLIVLDEPTASLDPKGRGEVEQALRRDGYGADLSCILVTHDISLAVRTCDRILVMKDGKIVWSGGVTELGLLPALEVAYGCVFSRMTPDDGTETFIVPR